MGLTQSMLSWPMVLPTPSFSGDGAAALMNRQPCEAVYAFPFRQARRYPSGQCESLMWVLRSASMTKGAVLDVMLCLPLCQARRRPVGTEGVRSRAWLVSPLTSDSLSKNIIWMCNMLHQTRRRLVGTEGARL